MRFASRPQWPKIWSNFAQRTPAVLDFPLGGRSRETGGGNGANGGGGGNGIDVLTQRSVVSTAGNSRASFGKFPFWNENMLSSISFCESEWSKYFRICLQHMFIFLYQWYLLTYRRWPRRGELLYPAALFRLLGEIFSYNHVRDTNRVLNIYLNFGSTFDIQVSIRLCFISPTQRSFHTLLYLLKTTRINDLACCAPDNMKGDNYSKRYHTNIS